MFEKVGPVELDSHVVIIIFFICIECNDKDVASEGIKFPRINEVMAGQSFHYSLYNLERSVIQRVGSGGGAPMSGDTLAPVNCGEVPQVPMVTNSSAAVG